MVCGCGGVCVEGVWKGGGCGGGVEGCDGWRGVGVVEGVECVEGMGWWWRGWSGCGCVYRVWGVEGEMGQGGGGGDLPFNPLDPEWDVVTTRLPLPRLLEWSD